MKKYIIGVISLLLSFNINAQRVVEKQITVNPLTNLELNLEFADSIIVKQSTDNSMKIKATVDINGNLNNDNYELITDEDSQLLRVSAKIHDMDKIRIPCNNYHGSSYNYNNGKCLTMDIKYEIEVPSVANIKLKTISGDIIINKNVCSMSIESISGFIDLRIPSSADSDIRIKTVTGGVYTNHEYNKNSDECDSNPGGTKANFRLGNGGNKIKLTTVSGDIYVRKI